ncbi:sensor histidine kinase [Nocardia sp. NPDC020380]|uniref:sensor histidine kinase n=1 Tax=Nocardia sp. NPDC020380 TaxID=3364309 RepID=UPI0037AAA38F
MLPTEAAAVRPGRPKRTRSLRAHVRLSIVMVAALAVLLFAVPLAVAVQRMDRAATVTELQRDAVRVAAVVPDTIASDGGPVQLPSGLPAGLTVGVYTATGRLIRESGPATSNSAAAAADGRIHVVVEGPDLAVSAPVPSDRDVSATVRVAVPDRRVTDRTLRTWAIMTVLGLMVIGVAALLARYQGRRIAGPLERLTEAARALGDGDFTIHPQPSRISEADALADALEATADRLGGLLERERAFTTQASHQLRTPLTALLLGLESALERPGADLREAIQTAVRRGHQLDDTIEDLLRLARAPRSHTVPPVHIDSLLGAVHDRWHAAFTERGRPFHVRIASDIPPVRVSATAIRHIVDVLVDNALMHGAGETTVTAETTGDGLLIEICDHGTGVSDPEAVFAQRPQERAGTHGIGLALARSLAEAEGGRLLLRRAAPNPVFGLLLPTGDRNDSESGPQVGR